MRFLIRSSRWKGHQMEEKEKLFRETKSQLIILNKKGLISSLQLSFLLVLARKKLNLPCVDISIYL